MCNLPTWNESRLDFYIGFMFTGERVRPGRTIQSSGRRTVIRLHEPLGGECEGVVGAVPDTDLVELPGGERGSGAEHGVDAALEGGRPPLGGVGANGLESRTEVKRGEERRPGARGHPPGAAACHGAAPLVL